MREGAMKRFGIKQKQEGREEGREEEKFNIARKMVNSDMSFDEIANFTGLTLNQIKSL